MTSKWIVLYAKRGGAKKKSYRDGLLLVTPNKIILLDENEKRLDERFLRKSETVSADCPLELDHYLVQVESCKCGANAGVSTAGRESEKAPERSPPKRRRLSLSMPERDKRTPAQVAERLRAPTKPVQKPEHENEVHVASTSQPASFNLARSLNRSSTSGIRTIMVDRNAPVQFSFQVAEGPVERKVAIPDKFQNLFEYKSIMSEALIEEIGFVVSDFAGRFKAAKEKISASRVPEFTWKSNAGSYNSLLPEELEKAYGSADINFLSDCRFIKRSSKPGFISVRLGRATEPLNYSKGDLMIISSSSHFLQNNSDLFTVVATADSYGSSRNSSVVELRLHGEPVLSKDGASLFVLQGPNIRSELSMLDCVRKIEQSSTPLLPILIGSQAYIPRSLELTSVMDSAARSAILKYKLNDDQAAVLFRVSGWLSAQASANPEICLVHGPFGSGKSHLLVALIIFLSDVLKEKGDTKTRFIITSATNSAVDRVLTGLLELGFDDFLRVGSLRKIASNILPYSVHKSCEKDEAERDLKELLKETFGAERTRIENELKAIRDGKLIARRKKLQRVRVVGVTCYSAINEVLQGNTFKFCLLDECSQILEPLSLLPISQFRCEKLVAVGDPAQLPPVLHGNTVMKDNKTQNLSRTLFVRLAALEHKPVLLRTQYRCHPRLARIPNHLFYEGELLDGCSEMERMPLISGLEPVVFCDTCKEGRERRDASGSFCNEFEAKVVSFIIKSLISKGVSGNQIGVITLYKAQEYMIRQLLFSSLDNVSLSGKKTPAEDEVKVSTVDAFQGMEKDLIILSCCRTTGLGFLTSPQRLNVALTRAKHHLIIIGNSMNLQRDRSWEQLFHLIKRKASCFKTVSEMKMCIAETRNELRTSELQQQSEETTPGSSDFTLQKLQEKSPNTLLGKAPSGELSGWSSLLNQTQTTAGVENLCSPEMKQALDDLHFGPRDFWEGYKLYCIGYYSHSAEHQESFSETLMAEVFRRVHGDEADFEWRKNFDDLVRSSWCMIEEYINQNYGVDCGDIRFLVQEYDDPEQLAASEHGSNFLELCKAEIDTPSAQNKVEERGSFVDHIMDQLSSMDARLAKLSRASS